MKIPWEYDRNLIDIAVARRVLERHYHPEYLRRLFAWLEHNNGLIGIGGHWRATQPSKPGFAKPGTSFHQTQRFASGFEGACAVDLVKVRPGRKHVSPAWSDVPIQGSLEARAWGVHCNIGTPSDTYPDAEPWHMQPVEIDGYETWIAAGRPDPVAGYPLPNLPPPIEIPEEDIDMVELMRVADDAAILFRDGLRCTSIPEQYTVDTLTADGIVTGTVRLVHRQSLKAFELVGPAPSYAGYTGPLPGRTKATDFAVAK